MKATGDIEEIRRWAQSPEGVQATKSVIDWGRKKLKQLERSQRVSPARMMRPMTR